MQDRKLYGFFVCQEMKLLFVNLLELKNETSLFRGKYDEEYFDYLATVLKRAGEHGFRCFLDPHQDVVCHSHRFPSLIHLVVSIYWWKRGPRLDDRISWI
jgi:hypothetical protein